MTGKQRFASEPAVVARALACMSVHVLSETNNDDPIKGDSLGGFVEPR
ncbi:MAG: hypothetical protein GWN09_08655 [Gammaproteobacteria bacterium]|nr:hypothetical protein [Gammaproteobacteria bacterium]